MAAPNETIPPEREDFAKRVFRRAAAVTVACSTGEEQAGRGFISALRKETGEPGGKLHPLGFLSRPLYHFIGWLPGAELCKGGTMTQAGAAYTVLDLRRVMLGGCELCVRALLERRDEDECQ